MATLLARQGTAMQKAVACRRWPHLPLRPSPPATTCRLLVPPPRRLHAGSGGIFSRTDVSMAINRRGGLPSLTHHTRASLSHLYLFTILSSFIWSKARSFIWELVLWIILCMNNIKYSSMFFLLYYQYSHVMKLVQSSFVIHLAYETLCLILHTTYPFRPRPGLR